LLTYLLNVDIVIFRHQYRIDVVSRLK